MSGIRGAASLPEDLAPLISGQEGQVVFGPSGLSALEMFDLHPRRASRREWAVAGRAAEGRVRSCRVVRIPHGRAAAWLSESLTPVEVGLLMALEPGTWELRSEGHVAAIERLAVHLRLGRARTGALIRAAEVGPDLASRRLGQVAAAADA